VWSIGGMAPNGEIKYTVEHITVVCVIFWFVLRRMVFNIRRFGTLCLFHLHKRVDMK
jgi:hypothetical protein